MSKNRRILIISSIIIYFLISLILIRANMLVSRGYEFAPDIIGNSVKSLVQVPFAVPKVEELKAFGLFNVVALFLLLDRFKNSKNYRKNKEYGSAVWGRIRQLKPYIDKNKDDNLLFSKNTKLQLDKGRAKRNNNVFVVGGSGSGKSRFLVKPNLLQQHSSYIITDPKGEMLQDTGQMFEKAGYNIKVLDLYNMENSFKYNPFAYIEDEQDILVLIDNLISNTQAPDQRSNDPFWEKSEKALLQSLIAYIHFFIDDKEDKNFTTVLRLLELAQSNDDKKVTTLDRLMEESNKKEPNNFAYRQYQIFKQSADKTRQSILISTSVRLSPFNIKSVAELTKYDEMEIDRLADEKTVVYVLLSDTNQTYNFLVAMYLEQVFQRLYHINDFEKSLAYPVRLMLDEFANIGRINQFEQRLATMRSRKISSTIITQDLSQIEAKYKKSWKSLIGNCDTFVYVGSNEKHTNEYVSKLLGKETLDIATQGTSRGRNRSTSTNHQRLGRELLTSDELGNLDDRESIVIIRGLDPFKDNKYPLEKHKRYDLLHDKADDNKDFNYINYKKSIQSQEQPEQNLSTFTSNLLEINNQDIMDYQKMIEEQAVYHEQVEEHTDERSDLTQEEKEKVIKSFKEFLLRTETIKQELDKKSEALLNIEKEEDKLSKEDEDLKLSI